MAKDLTLTGVRSSRSGLTVWYGERRRRRSKRGVPGEGTEGTGRVTGGTGTEGSRKGRRRVLSDKDLSRWVKVSKTLTDRGHVDSGGWV